LRILVYEHVSGGGFAEKPIPRSILCEGFGMLRTLTADLQAAGHLVTTLLDSRIYAFKPPLSAERVVPVASSKQTKPIIKDNARSIDAALVIAPESNGILKSTITELEEEHVPLVNGLSSAISAVNNKQSLSEHLRNIGVSTPDSLAFNVYDDMFETSRIIAERIGFPAVFKPENDAGMAGLSLVESKAEITVAVKKITRESTSDRFIAQQHVKGVPASVSLISTGKEAVSISLNKQKVTLSSPYSASTYEGGEVPFESQLKNETMSAAKRVVESYEELKGYIGVDFVLTKETPVVIEINPRLTTSYIGLREVTQFNPAEAMLKAAIHHKLPADVPNKGYACFAKVEMSRLSVDELQEIYSMKSVVSPPFPISSEPTAFALISSNGATLGETNMQLENMKRKLCGISHSGESQA